MVLCYCTTTAAAAAATTTAAIAASVTATAPTAAAEDLCEVIHDGCFFRVHQIKLPDEKDEVYVECVQMSMQFQCQRFLEV